jgi:hypothetical protein
MWVREGAGRTREGWRMTMKYRSKLRGMLCGLLTIAIVMGSAIAFAAEAKNIIVLISDGQRSYSSF